MTLGRSIAGSVKGGLLLMAGLGVAAGGEPAQVAAQSPEDMRPVPRVLVIATGGTIAGQNQGGQLTGAQIIDAVPGLSDVASIDVEEFSRIGSSSMTPAHWLRLSRLVNDRLDADPNLAGVIVMHGTDTMEETAYFLHLTVQDTRPVVLVGSMRNASAVSADGPANVLSAARVATSTQAHGMGVLVVLNDAIHSARDVRKMDNNRVDTFRSTEWGAMGVVDADDVVFRRMLANRHTIISDLHLPPALVSLPDVRIVADYTGNDGSALRAAAASGAEAVIVQAFGGGRASPGMREAIAEAGIPVVLTSRVPEGRVLSTMSDADSGVIAGGDLPPHKARVLAMLALAKGAGAVELQRLFTTH